MKLGKHDIVIAVAPEFHSGPGWANKTLTVVVLGAGGQLRRECLQPHEMSAEIVTLFTVGAAMHEALKAAVVKAQRPRNAARSKRR